jgi:hypothetical protein
MIHLRTWRYLMASNSTDKIDNERLRVHHAFWLSIFGLALAAALAVFLVIKASTKVDSSAEVVAIVGLFTSVTGTLVGAFFGLQIGAAGANTSDVVGRRRRRVARGRKKQRE